MLREIIRRQTERQESGGGGGWNGGQEVGEGRMKACREMGDMWKGGSLRQDWRGRRDKELTGTITAV